MNVCIFGASSSNIPECYIEFAEKLGVPVVPVTNDGAEFADKLTGAYEQ